LKYLALQEQNNLHLPENIWEMYQKFIQPAPALFQTNFDDNTFY